jgi:DNA-binding IclR family transcriptional regulator
MPERRTDNRNTLQTLRRGLQALELMATAGPIGVGELGRRMKVPKTVAHRLVKTLQEEGYAVRDTETDKSKLTFRMFTVGASIPHRIGLHDCVKPYLERLVAQTGETANLGVLDGPHMVYVQKAESSEPFRLAIPIGQRTLPAFCTAIGKAILAFLPPAQVDRVFAETTFTAQTPHTITNIKAIEREFARVRARGFAIDKEEFSLGVLCVAAPIMLHGTEPIAGISVVGTTSRIRRSQLENIAIHVRDAAVAISKELDLVDR